MVALYATFYSLILSHGSQFRATQQALVKSEKSFVDLKHIIVMILYEIFDDNIKFVAVGEREASLHQQFLCFLQRQFQCDRKCDGRRLAWFVVHITSDLGEKLSVNICFFIALGIAHPFFVDFSQEHLRKALVDRAEPVIQALRCLHTRRSGRMCSTLREYCGFSVIVIPQRIGVEDRASAVIMSFHITFINVFCNVVDEFFADLEAGFIINDDLDQHIVFQKEAADLADGDLQGLILGVSVSAG